MDDKRNIAIENSESSDDELQQKLIDETDPNELKNIIDIFNLNIQKKNILRANKLSELQDKISQQMEDRIEKNAGAFSNKDLLDYFKVVQDTLNKSGDDMDAVNLPVIQINQQQININKEENKLDRQSKERVLKAVQAILNKCSDDNSDLEIIDVDAIEDEKGDIIDIDESDINEER